MSGFQIMLEAIDGGLLKMGQLGLESWGYDRMQLVQQLLLLCFFDPMVKVSGLLVVSCDAQPVSGMTCDRPTTAHARQSYCDW